MKHLLCLLAAALVLGCEGEIDVGAGQRPVPERVAAPVPVPQVAAVFDETAVLARGLAFRKGGFTQLSVKYESKATLGAGVTVWVSDDALATYQLIRPDADGSKGFLPLGGIVVREVFNAAGVLTKLTFVSQGPPGFNPASGDLWFASTDASGRLLEQNGVSLHGALSSCSGCHAARPTDGFLFGVPTQYRFMGGPTPFDAGVVAPFDAGVVVPFDAGVVVPFDAGIVVPFDAGIVVPFDAGIVARFDAGIVAPFDAGVVAPVDAGIVAPFDAGVRPVDAGVVVPFDAGVVTPIDAGIRLDAGVPSIDLSDFELRNQESSLLVPQSATFGPITLAAGQRLVIARNATRAEFEAAWSTQLGPNVLFANAQATGSRDAPIVNGGEVWALLSPQGTVVDGPSVSGIAGFGYTRTTAGWVQQPLTQVTPGVVNTSTVPRGLRVVQWSDATDFRMEFVTIGYFPEAGRAGF